MVIRDQEKNGLCKKIESCKYHNRVVGPVLVADKEASKAVEDHFALVIDRGQGFEQLVRDSEDWDVLKVRIVVQAVACDVVHRVVPLPPPDADSCHTIPCQNLCMHCSKEILFFN